MKALLKFLALLALAFFAASVFAADAATDTAGAVADVAGTWIGGLMTSHPWIATVLVVIGAFRVVAKPLMSLAHTLAAYTPTPKDDAIVDKVEASWAWRAFCWALDWTTSLKVGTQRPTVPTSTTANTGT